MFGSDTRWIITVVKGVQWIVYIYAGVSSKYYPMYAPLFSLVSNRSVPTRTLAQLPFTAAILGFLGILLDVVPNLFQRHEDFAPTGLGVAIPLPPPIMLGAPTAGFCPFPTASDTTKIHVSGIADDCGGRTRRWIEHTHQ